VAPVQIVRSVHGDPRRAVVTGMFGGELMLDEFSSGQLISSRTGWGS
jgi:hypothetical protein